jgi:hypothetical protein
VSSRQSEKSLREGAEEDQVPGAEPAGKMVQDRTSGYRRHLPGSAAPDFLGAGEGDQLQVQQPQSVALEFSDRLFHRNFRSGRLSVLLSRTWSAHNDLRACNEARMNSANQFLVQPFVAKLRKGGYFEQVILRFQKALQVHEHVCELDRPVIALYQSQVPPEFLTGRRTLVRLAEAVSEQVG